MFDFAGSPIGALTVSADPPARSARVELWAPGPAALYSVAIAPAPDGDGRLVTDPADLEPTHRPTLAAAVDLALSLASAALADRAGAMLSPGGTAAPDPTVVGAPDVC